MMADAKTSMQVITPELASKWLERIPDYQRKIDPKQVKKLVTAITKNEWRVNGATIVFSDGLDLLDGQHRLTAIAQAGKPVQSLVCRGVSAEEEVFQTIGDEKARKVTDFMKGKNVIVVAAVIRMYYMMLNGRWPVGSGQEAVPFVELLKLTKKWAPDIEALVAPMFQAGKVLGQLSFCTFLFFYYAKVQPWHDEARLAEFFGKIGTGLELTAQCPVYKLRQRFFGQISSSRMSRTVAQAIIVKALHLYLDHESSGNLKFEPNREDFPKLRTVTVKGKTK